MAHEMIPDNEDQPFHLETHGIDIIPSSERKGRPRQLFGVWLAAQFTISGIIIGQLFTTLGLSVWEALGVAALSAVSFVVVGLSSLPGPKAGTATLTISRASFGIKGNVVPSFLSWLVLVGWESVTIVLTVASLLLVAQLLHWPSQGTAPTIIAMAVALLMTFSIPILGHGTVVRMQQLLAYSMGLFVLAMFPLIWSKVNWHYAPAASHMAAHGALATFVLACSIGLMSTSLSWTNYGSDYSRYLAKDTPRTSILAYTAWGGGLAVMLFLSLGVLLGTFINASTFGANPMKGTMAVLPAWFAFPFLFVVVIGQVANNYMNSYSSSMSFLAMGFRLPRYASVIVDAVISSIVALYALFLAPGFISFFENFLSLSILFLGPWTGVFLTHYFLFKGEYDAPSLLITNNTSSYWYQNGTNRSAFIALIVGAFAAFWTVNSALWVSPLSTNLLGGMDLSAFVGPIVGSAVYYMFMRPVRIRHTKAAGNQPIPEFQPDPE